MSFVMKELLVSLNPFMISVTILVMMLLSSYVPRWRLHLRYRKLPPGPFCFPFIGYPPFFNLKSNHIALQKEALKYGGVFSIYIGSQFTVVIDDFEALKDAYKQEEIIAHPEEAIRVSPDPSQISILSLNATRWKEHRRFLRFISSGSESLRSVIMSQISEVISSLKQQLKQDVNIDHEVELALNNVTFQLIFGKTFDHNHSVIKFLGDYNMAMINYATMNNVKSFMPCLGSFIFALPLARTHQMFNIMEQMDDLIRNEILEHRKTRNADEPRDLIDRFLNQMDKHDKEEEFNMSSLLGNAKVILLGSSETVRTTLVWFLLLMAKHPEIQEMILAEVDDVIGRERQPSLDDQLRLPLLHAAIMESMRFKNVLNINFPRRVSKDTTLCGYDIPKGTFVLHNFASHFRNPQYWKNPELFDPTRFLSENKRNVQVPEHFIPFSYGPRTCLGEKMADTTVFLFSASLLQHFRICPPEGGVNLKVKMIYINSYEHPFLKLKSRD